MINDIGMRERRRTWNGAIHIKMNKVNIIERFKFYYHIRYEYINEEATIKFFKNRKMTYIFVFKPFIYQTKLIMITPMSEKIMYKLTYEITVHDNE